MLVMWWVLSTYCTAHEGQRGTANLLAGQVGLGELSSCTLVGPVMAVLATNCRPVVRKGGGGGGGEFGGVDQIPLFSPSLHIAPLENV